ncbi:MAG: hypothetical protein LC808_21345, partial [Actinobacteria bacterium]|nr:hypothetical protein [Actinomycetota bacterium]
MRISLLEEALTVLGDGDSDLRVRVLAELAKTLYFSPEERRRNALAQEALEIARRLGQPTVLVGALSATRVIRWGPTNTELRLAYSDEILALSEQSGDPELVVRSRLGRLADLIEIGRREDVEQELDATLAAAADLRQPYYIWRALSWGALKSMVNGEWDEAEQRVADSLEVWHSDLHPDALQCSRIQRATLAAVEGRPAEAADLLRLVAGVHPMIPSYRCLLARALLQAERPEEARREFGCFAADGFLSPPMDANWLMGITALAETCAGLDDRERANVLYELLFPFGNRMVVLDAFGGGFSGPVSYYLGLLACTMTRPVEAHAHLTAALE